MYQFSVFHHKIGPRIVDQTNESMFRFIEITIFRQETSFFLWLYTTYTFA
jgi:hypothetical protein